MNQPYQKKKSGTRDRKVMKNINYFRPDLKQFFTQEELDKKY